MKKHNRPITRKFWPLLRYLPTRIRAIYLRRQFEVPEELPDDLVLKQAESEDEIIQALRLVYDSYLKLNYIDSNEAGLRLTKFHLLPTTIILVAKRKNEVIGTLSIIMDTSLKLPSDLTWDLSGLRRNGRQIAEISSLTIKKNELRRGKLLLPLCKLMYQYCKSLLNLDGIVVSATTEVEAFYTDLLLFKKVVNKTGQANQVVKGNPSTCCYLDLSDSGAKENYRRVYDKKRDRFNLFKFFIKRDLKNIQLPTQQQCIQSYTVRQTVSHSKILETFPELAKNFTERDCKVIANLDVSNILSFEAKKSLKDSIARTYRYEIRQKVWCYLAGVDKIVPSTLLNLSESGFKMVLHEDGVPLSSEKSVFIFFTVGNKIFQFYGQIVWAQPSANIGCRVEVKNKEWLTFQDLISSEYQNKVV